MKTLTIAMLVSAFGFMSFAPNTTIGDPIAKTANASAVTWKADAVEVGEIPQGTPKTIEFSFKNTGTSDVVITSVKPACGCTAADYTKTPIKPGGTGPVKSNLQRRCKRCIHKVGYG